MTGFVPSVGLHLSVSTGDASDGEGSSPASRPMVSMISMDRSFEIKIHGHQVPSQAFWAQDLSSAWHGTNVTKVTGRRSCKDGKLKQSSSHGREVAPPISTLPPTFAFSLDINMRYLGDEGWGPQTPTSIQRFSGLFQAPAGPLRPKCRGASWGW